MWAIVGKLQDLHVRRESAFINYRIHCDTDGIGNVGCVGIRIFNDGQDEARLAVGARNALRVCGGEFNVCDIGNLDGALACLGALRKRCIRLLEADCELTDVFQRTEFVRGAHGVAGAARVDTPCGQADVVLGYGVRDLNR